MEERFETFTALIASINHGIRKLKTEIMAEFDLKSTHLYCLYYLYKSGSLTAKELCDMCAEDKALISRSIKLLEHYGIKGIALAEYVKSLDNDNIVHLTSRDDFVYTYPNRIKSQFMNGVYSNQLRTIINRLSTCDGTNRAVATIYNPLLDERINDIPCLQWIQCTIRNDKFRIHCMFRSNDIYGAWYSNMLFLTYLAFEIIEMLEERNIFVTFDGIEYHSTSAHIYKKDIDDAIKLFKEVGAA